MRNVTVLDEYKNKIKKFIHTRVAYLIIFLIAITSITFSLTITSFFKNIDFYMSKINSNKLNEIAARNNEAVSIMFDGYYSILNTVRIGVEGIETESLDDILAYLAIIADENKFYSLSIEAPNGRSYISDGSTLELSWYNHSVDDLLKDGKYISDVMLSENGIQQVINLVLPLRDKKGEYKGALRGAVSTDTIVEQLNFSKFDGEGYYHLLDHNGLYIATSDSNNSGALLMDENYFDAIEKLTFPEGFSAKKVKEDIQNGSPGFTKYGYEGNNRNVYYRPVGINKWTMQTIIPTEVVDNQVNQINYFALQLVLSIAAILSMLFIVILVIIIYSKKQAAERKRKFVLMQLQQENLFREINNEMFDNILEADLTHNKLIGENAFKLIPLLKISEDSTYDEMIDAIVTQWVREDFHEVYLEKMSRKNILERYHAGIDNFNFETIERADGKNYAWTKVTVRIYYSSITDSICIISYVKKIEEEKKQERLLREKASCDPMTKLYNKVVTEDLITQYLETTQAQTETHAFVIIDIDNFKNINDTFGHAFGDQIIIELASQLKASFKDTDIIGRIGGDEFVIFVKDCAKEEDLNNRLENLRSAFKKGDISLGVAIYPQHGTEYQALYKNADAALYNSKNNGKNTFTYFCN